MRSSWADAFAALPLITPEDLVGNRHVLVIAPHPDDESLGCGGLLAWAARTGHQPRVLFLTDGEKSHPGSALFPTERLAGIRRQEGVDACAALGLACQALTYLGYPDGGLSSLNAMQGEALTSEIRRWISVSGSSAVFVTAQTDPHGDHEAAYGWTKRAVQGCTQARLFAYPVWTWIRDDLVSANLALGRRLSTGPFGDAKRAAIAAHASQLGKIVNDASEPFVLPPPLLAHLSQDYEVVFHVQL
ncbi:MAG: PIG-L family deacetylase [Pseudomonadota bacterium]|nr:PIG-L family deacetylase [Pseudomonadota bacterium]